MECYSSERRTMEAAAQEQREPEEEETPQVSVENAPEARNDIPEAVIAGESMEIEEPSKPEQPELPVLKNNDQRAAFVDAYEIWPLWIETVQTGERYYRYDLEDGTSMVVKVYHAMLFAGWVEGNYENRYNEGYGRHEYYLLRPGKFFRDCEASRTTLIEKLNEIQKVKKGNGDDGHKTNG